MNNLTISMYIGTRNNEPVDFEIQNPNTTGKVLDILLHYESPSELSTVKNSIILPDYNDRLNKMYSQWK